MLLINKYIKHKQAQGTITYCWNWQSYCNFSHQNKILVLNRKRACRFGEPKSGRPLDGNPGVKKTLLPSNAHPDLDNLDI